MSASNDRSSRHRGRRGPGPRTAGARASERARLGEPPSARGPAAPERAAHENVALGVEVTRATSVTSPLRGFVVCARLLEPLLAEELSTLLDAPGAGTGGEPTRGPSVQASRGGVFWSGDARTAAQIVYGSRLASRVLVERLRVRGRSARLTADDVYALLLEAPWEQVLAPGASIAIAVHARRAQIEHSVFAAQRVKDAIVDRLRALGQARPGVDLEQPDCRWVVVVDGPDVVVSQDLTGDALFRRGLRVVETEAPLREDIAAAVLWRAGWPFSARVESLDDAALVDPMCGSGTFLSEAVLMALDAAPGLMRPGDASHDHEVSGDHDAQIRGHGILGEAAIWREAEAAARDWALGRLRLRIDALRVADRWPVMRGADRDPRAIAASRARWDALGERLSALLCGRVDERSGGDDAARLAAVRAFLVRVEWHESSIDALTPPVVTGATTRLLLANPPWGERLKAEVRDGAAGHEQALAAVYEAFGRALAGPFAGWSGAVISAWPGAAAAARRPWARRYALRVGATDATLLLYSPDAQVPAEDPDALSDSAREVYNRLVKVWAQRLKQARRSDWRSFRVYDADLPEYAFAVDVYHEDRTPPERASSDCSGVADDACAWSERLRRVVAAEYAPPAGVDPALATRRRREFLRALRLALDVPRERVFLKTRARQRGHRQYQRAEAPAGPDAVFWMREGEARLKVDLVTHLDTGVFLDHRQVRQWIAEALRERRVAAGGGRAPHFLNLFAYTGTASVQAAVAGASTVSVDLSPVYLGWAAENLSANGFSPSSIEGLRDAARARRAINAAPTSPRVFRRGGAVDGVRDGRMTGDGNAPVHRLVRADVLAWLDVQAAGRPSAAALADGEAFDVILVDPPSFSTSKRMQAAFDVQRDHVALIDAAMRLLRRDGVLVFSNNLRRFKLDPALAARYAVEDRGAASIPADFARNPRIHHCWWLRWPGDART